MFALTVKQPHAYHILNSGKDIENRTWKLPERHHNIWIALHAGKAGDKHAISKLSKPEQESLVYGAIIGFMKFSDCVENHPSSWAIADCYHWIISEVMSTKEVIYCKGNQGLWRLNCELVIEANQEIYLKTALIIGD